MLRSICSSKYANNCVSRNKVASCASARCVLPVSPVDWALATGGALGWQGGSHSTSLAPSTGSAPSSPLRYNAYAMQPVAGQPTASAHVVSERASKMYWVRMKRKI